METESLASQIATLNPAQKEAVTASDGPMLVIAGAGSGKTRVLTMRIAYLIAQGVKPYNILALTFTNKAANEMKERIMKIVGDEARYLWMGTFHSVFAYLLRTEAQTLGLSSNFSIYDTKDSENLVKNIVKGMGIEDSGNYKPKDLACVISSVKNDLISPQAYASDANFSYRDTAAHRPKMAQIYAEYVNECRKANALDFDDLLYYTNTLLRDHPEVLEKYQKRFTHILVDEYQDTNLVQYAIINRLAKMSQKVCVVGDDAQSIYGFRGARIENILNFQKDYPDARLFKLEQNYRSTQNIVGVANNLIAKNKNQIAKNVFSEGDKGEAVHVWTNECDKDEARRTVADIARRIRRQGASPNDFAILYRNNYLSRIFEEELRRQAIPYRIYGGTSFYQRREVKDVLAYLRLIINHNDIEALRRIINLPKRQIGDTTVDAIERTARELGSSPWDVMTIAPQLAQTGLRNAPIQKLNRFTAMIETLTQQAQQMDAYQLAVETMSQSGLLQMFNDEKDTDEGKDRFDNVQELLNGIKEFTDSQIEQGESASVSLFLQQVSLITDMDKADDNDRVNLMTIHASKGLEFGHVYIVAVEEGIFPSERCAIDPKSLEEERRLMYVAITRAKKTATISYAQNRFAHGKVMPGIRSCFFKDLDSRFCDGLRELDSTTSFAQQTGGYDPFHSTRRDIFSQRQTPRLRPTTQSTTPPVRTLPKVDRRLTQSELASTPADSISQTPDGKFRVGSRVRHSRFGVGTIKDIFGTSADDMKLRIAFDGDGEKTLLLKFARIEAI